MKLHLNVMEDACDHLGKGASGIAQLFPQLTHKEGFSTPYSLLLFGAGSCDLTLWRPLLLVVTDLLEELPLKPLQVGSQVTELSQWPLITLPGPDIIPCLHC